jgi:hypothetical protein
LAIPDEVVIGGATTSACFELRRRVTEVILNERMRCEKAAVGSNNPPVPHNMIMRQILGGCMLLKGE